MQESISYEARNVYEINVAHTIKDIKPSDLKDIKWVYKYEVILNKPFLIRDDLIKFVLERLGCFRTSNAHSDIKVIKSMKKSDSCYQLWIMFEDGEVSTPYTIWVSAKTTMLAINYEDITL